MKKAPQTFVFAIVTALALAVMVPTTQAKGGGKPTKPKIPLPTLIEDVDAASHTIKIVSGEKRTVTSYTANTFTQVFINDKPGKFEDLKKGMRVSVGGKDGGNATRIDASDMTGSSGKK